MTYTATPHKKALKVTNTETGVTFFVKKAWFRADGTLTPAGKKAEKEQIAKNEKYAKLNADKETRKSQGEKTSDYVVIENVMFAFSKDSAKRNLRIKNSGNDSRDLFPVDSKDLFIRKQDYSSFPADERRFPNKSFFTVAMTEKAFFEYIGDLSTLDGVSVWKDKFSSDFTSKYRFSRPIQK